MRILPSPCRTPRRGPRPGGRARRLRGWIGRLTWSNGSSISRAIRIRGCDFASALALGDTSDPRAVAALARIARRDAANRWIRTAVLSSCSDIGRSAIRGAHGGPIAAGRTSSLRPCSHCSSRSSRSSVRGIGPTRSTDSSTCWRPRTGHSPTAARLDAAQPLVLALAEGLRRSGGQLADRSRLRRGPAPRWSRGWCSVHGPKHGTSRRPSRRCLVRSNCWQRSTPTARATSCSSGSRQSSRWRCRSRRCGRWPRVARPTSPTSCCRGCAGSSRRSARRRSGRSSAAPTGPRPCCERSGRCGGPDISPGSIDPSDRAPLLKHRDPEIARLAQALFGVRRPARARR